MQIRRQNKRTNKSYLATMTMLGFISSTSRRTVVRAAFTAGDVCSKTAFGRVGHTNVRPFISHAKSSPKFALYEREPINRAMSTSTDQELDSALDELLGDALKGVEAPAAEESALDELLNEALKEAETPAAEAGSGHIEGSHPFPKDLIEKETVCSLLHYLAVVITIVRSRIYPFHNILRRKTLQILNFFLLPIQDGHKLVFHKM